MRTHLPRRPAGPDRAAAIAQYRRRAPVYDAELAAFEPLRIEAVRKLALRPGDRVIDAGCGTGLSFALLHERIGDTGAIAAFDQSPEMLDIARRRVRSHGWPHIELLHGPAASVNLHGKFDAALLHFVHDILREEAALDHVLAPLSPGARVVATGLQWASPWLWPTNGFVLLAALHSVSSLEGLARPWDLLAERLEQVHVDTALLGGVFILSGRVRTPS